MWSWLSIAISCHYFYFLEIPIYLELPIVKINFTLRIMRAKSSIYKKYEFIM